MLHRAIHQRRYNIFSIWPNLILVNIFTQHGDIHRAWIRIDIKVVQSSIFKFNKSTVHAMSSILPGFCVEYVNYINIDITACSGRVSVIATKACVNTCKVRVCILQLKGSYYGTSTIYIHELYVQCSRPARTCIFIRFKL